MNIFRICLVGALCVALSHCTAFQHPTAKKTRSTAHRVTTRKVDTPHGQIAMETKRPDAPVLAKSDSPQRIASLQVVAHGKEQLAQKQYESALQLFQEACTLDGSNGIAYYYLARTHYALGNYTQAGGLLDRAETLLGDSDNWIASIHALREAMQAATVKSTGV